MLSTGTVMNDIPSKPPNDCQLHACGQVEMGTPLIHMQPKTPGGLMDFLINILCGYCTFVKISSGVLLTHHILMDFDSKI